LRRGHLLAKKRFNDRSKEFLFGQQPVNKVLPELKKQVMLGKERNGDP
jgi:hypothetical protein